MAELWQRLVRTVMTSFRIIVVIAIPSMIWFFVVSSMGTLFLPVIAGQSTGMALQKVVVFCLGPLGLFALIQLMRVIRLMPNGGVNAIYEHRRTVWLGAAAGFIPVVYYLPLVAKLCSGLKREPALSTFIVSGIPMLPLLVFVLWASIRPRDPRNG